MTQAGRRRGARAERWHGTVRHFGQCGLRHEAAHVDLVPRFRKLPTAGDEAADRAARLLTDLVRAEAELENLLGIVRITPAHWFAANSGITDEQARGMTSATRAVLAEALRLDPDARAELATELLGSLDGPPDPDARAAWTLEIDRRVAAIDAGTVQIESWEDAKRRIEREILGR